MRAPLFLKLTVFTLLSTSVFGAGDGWMTDFEAAKKKATTENKDLLLEFTGSDWCPPCKTLNQKVFSKPEFIKNASEKFILVVLDFPNDKQLPAAEKAQNDKLIVHYGVTAYPTILLCDANGLPYAAHGLQQGGPKEYLTALYSKLPAKAALKKAIADADQLEGKAKAEALWKAIKSLKRVPVAASLGPILNSIQAADPSDTKVEGIYLGVEMLNIKAGDKYDTIFKRYDDYVAKQELDSLARQQLLIKKFEILYKINDFDGMRKVGAEVLAIDPQTTVGKSLVGFESRVDGAEEAYKKKLSK